ncbi:unnamed protein product, partial [Discosporangium mesarthrocarpum]
LYHRVRVRGRATGLCWEVLKHQASVSKPLFTSAVCLCLILVNIEYRVLSFSRFTVLLHFEVEYSRYCTAYNSFLQCLNSRWRLRFVRGTFRSLCVTGPSNTSTPA